MEENCISKLIEVVMHSKHITEIENVYTLPKTVTAVRVLSGQAWVTLLGEDIILYQGESTLLKPGNDGAIVSSLSDSPLVLEEIRRWGQGLQDRQGNSFALFHFSPKPIHCSLPARSAAPPTKK